MPPPSSKLQPSAKPHASTSTRIPSDEKPKQASQGAAKYHSCFQKAWSKEWSFIVALNGPHSFHCVICNRDVTCPHQGRADVERLIKSILHESNTKGAEGLCKLPFTSKKDPFAGNSLVVIDQNCSN